MAEQKHQSVSKTVCAFVLLWWYSYFPRNFNLPTAVGGIMQSGIHGGCDYCPLMDDKALRRSSCTNGCVCHPAAAVVCELLPHDFPLPV